MKETLAPIMIVSALAFSVAIIIEKTQAQNASPQPKDHTGGMMGPAAGAKTNNTDWYSIFVTNVPPGYRDWKLIFVAREEGALDDVRAILGNDKAIKAYLEGKPFTEGAIIARIAWSYKASEENNKTFGHASLSLPELQRTGFSLW